MPPDARLEDLSISGVKRLLLTQHDDARGSFTEFHRESWFDEPRPIQWNVVRSRPGSLRGIHVHVRHGDYLVVTDGHMQLGLGDLRESSTSFGQWLTLDLPAAPLQLIYIPPGVAHAFFFPTATQHLYGMSEYWCPEEEVGCFWRDPGVRLDWALAHPPTLSARDQQLGPLTALMVQLQPHQSRFG